MKLRKSLDLRIIFTFLYFASIFVYVAVGFLPADAAKYDIATNVVIPSIGLDADVATLHLEGDELLTPDFIVGRFTMAKHKTFLVGHASTVFRDLNQLEVGAEIWYDDSHYVVTDKVVREKSTINMMELLKETEKYTLVIMTCAGEDLGGGDATHRLIITAVIDE